MLTVPEIEQSGVPPALTSELDSLGIQFEDTPFETEYGLLVHGVNADFEQVCVKIKECESEEEAKNLLLEATAIQELDHPCIERIYAALRNGRCLCIVSSREEVECLTDYAAEVNKDYDQIVSLMLSLVDTLKAVHSAEVVHGYLKPSNITIHGNRLVVRNFGLYSKSKTSLENANHSSADYIAYFAPEKIITDSRPLESEKPIGRWTDVYGIGVVLYYLLTCKAPFSGTGSRLVDKIIYGRPVRPRLFGRDIPRNLDAVCMKSLSRRIPRRYSSVEELEKDFEAIVAGEPVSAVGLRRESVATALLVATITTSISAILIAGIALWASVSPVLEFEGITDFQDLSNSTSYSNGY